MTVIRQGLPFAPSPKALAAVNDAADGLRPDDATLAEWTASYLETHRDRLGTDLDIVLQQLPAGARVLDVGAAPYVTSCALAAAGFAVSAIDIAPQRFASLIERRGLIVHACDIEHEPLPLADRSMDAVLFNELFEHLRINPIFTLEEVRRVLRPGGKLLLSTPNLRSFRGIRNLLLHDQGHAVSGGIYRQFDKLRTLGHMGHVREYTATETMAFLDRIGFETSHLLYRGGYGKGVVGTAERLAPTLRPFFSVIATRGDDPVDTP